jgi:hypothetical protein
MFPVLPSTEGVAPGTMPVTDAGTDPALRTMGLLYERVKSACHWAYNVTFALIAASVTLPDAAYAVPVPLAAVFQPAKTYPVRVRLP